MREDVLELLRREKLISIVRGVPAARILPVAEALWRGGFRFLEITFDQSGATPDTETAAQIAQVRRAMDGRLHVGAGTVLRAEQLALAVEAGAEYIISPNTDVALIRATKAAGLLSIPGAFTPTEIAAADAAGADLVKLFPAECVDLRYIRAIRAPLCSIPLLAVGGVTPENLGAYLAAGVAGAGIGSALVRKDDVQTGNYDAIAQRAACYVAARDDAVVTK